MRKTSRSLVSALLCSIAALGCGKSGDGKSAPAANAVRTPSGLDGGRALSSLTASERMQFCSAATKTLYSVSTADRECELTGVLNTYQLPNATAMCQSIKSQCLVDFIDTEVLKCADLLVMSTGCKASVKDGEDCSFATASLRASLLPDLTCASDSAAAKASIADVYTANVLASGPECERYLTCQSGPPPGESKPGGSCDQLDQCCQMQPSDQQALCMLIAMEARKTKGDSECETLKTSVGCK